MKRLIPVLLISQRKLVKTVRFGNPFYLGDPLNALRVFSDLEPDELVVIDIDVTRRNTEIDFEYLQKLMKYASMPITYGGGVQSESQAMKLIETGFDKVMIKHAAYNNPNVIQNIANAIGSQGTIAVLDLKLGVSGTYVVDGSTADFLEESPLIWAQRFQNLGAGEILCTDIDREGTFQGPNVQLFEIIAKSIQIPLIAMGGVSKTSDLSLLWNVGVSGVAAGSFFVFADPNRAVLINYPSRRNRT